MWFALASYLSIGLLVGLMSLYASRNVPRRSLGLVDVVCTIAIIVAWPLVLVMVIRGIIEYMEDGKHD